MEILAKVFEIINSKISPAVAIFCAFLLYAPNPTLQRLNFLSFVDSNRTFISLAFLFFSLLYISEKTKRAYQFVGRKLQARVKKRALRKTVIANLAGLSREEKAWIYFCLRGNIRTLLAVEINATAVSLESKLLVYRPNKTYDRQATPFTLRTEAWEYLNKHKETYCPPDKLNNPQHNTKVDEFIASLKHV